MTMQLIETKTLGTAAASIEFTSIPQDGTDLFLLISGRGSNAEVTSYVEVSFNGSTSSFTQRSLGGTGSTANSFTIPARFLGETVGNGATSNTFGNLRVYIPNYSGSTNKSFSTDGVGENNATTAQQNLTAGLWSNTAAITSVTVSALSGANLLTGSTISLYKITKGSDGIVTTS
jgi:hypothetical protein